MNATLDLIHRHRSIRRFTPEPIPDADIRRAVEAGQAASTSSAVQAYSLLRVTDPAALAQLAELTGPQEKVARCGAFFAVCGDTRRHRIAVEDAQRAYDAHLEAFLLAVIDATLFAQNLVLAFEAMGYGICYIGGLRNRIAEVDRLLELPEGVYPLYGLCVGVPDEQPEARPRLSVDSVYFEDRYPDDEQVRAHLGEYDDRYRRYLAERGVAPEKIRGWSQIMASKFSTPQRDELAAYYAAKGAELR
ncbi:MAG: NADPH-dependent oxidoreductase [Planctomycetota bacterium]|jgi:FMN reductase (NADPH)